MSDSATRYLAHKAGPSTRTRSGSEAIRKRVTQLMQTTTLGSNDVVDRDRTYSRNTPSPHRNSLRDTRHKTSTKDKPLPITPSQPRALKRKKSSGLTGSSDRPENRVPTIFNVPVASTSKQTSSRVFDAMAYPPPLDHDLSPLSSQSHKNGRAVTKHPLHDTSTYEDAGMHDRRRGDGLRGPLAAAEFDRMKKEIETLKEALQDSRKTSKRNIKKLDETKLELNAAVSAIKDKESELANVKEKHKKSEELLSTIESSVQCQICMDLPAQPFAISPCGHVLCLLCLQEWFRKAPPTSDDMDIDPDELTDPHYILMRSKSCPTCRAVVKRRPVPVFMVKAVASALMKSKNQSTSHPALSSGDARGQETETDDPWKGIFLDGEEDSDDHDSADDYVVFDSDDSEALRQLSVGGSIFANIDSSDSEENDDEESDEDEDEGDGDGSGDEDEVYDLPRWSPPNVEIDPSDHRLREGGGPETFKLLQRGCSSAMIQNFDVSYSHHLGIVVSLHSLDQLYASESEDDGVEGVTHTDGMNRIYLGWNISLPEYDVDGELYLADVLEDIKNNPVRWTVSSRPGVRGARDAKRLVRAVDVEDYDTTDSEVWIDAEDF